jgi:hypothetical protein
LPSSAKPHVQLCCFIITTQPVKVSKKLSTPPGKLKLENNLNFFMLMEDDLKKIMVKNQRKRKREQKWKAT